MFVHRFDVVTTSKQRRFKPVGNKSP